MRAVYEGLCLRKGGGEREQEPRSQREHTSGGLAGGLFRSGHCKERVREESTEVLRKVEGGG
jgi:hypothetical protein